MRAERQQRLAGLDAGGIEPDFRARRVMRGQHARRQRLAGVAVRHPRAAAPARGRARVRFRRAARRRGAAAPARRSSRRWWNSTPTSTGPPSTIRSIRPARSLCTCAAVVGETWPDKFADGATTGRPNARRMSRARGCAGTRIAIVSRPAVARSATAQSVVFGSTSVSGPGQKASAERHRLRVEAGNPHRGADIPDMGDQRIERGPALGLVEPRNRACVGGVGAEAVDGLGRERDQPAVFEATRGRGDGGLAGGQNSCFQAHIHGVQIPGFGFLRCAKPEAISRVLVGVWLSPVEHCVRDAGVAGSNPATPTSFTGFLPLFPYPFKLTPGETRCRASPAPARAIGWALPRSR